VDGNGTILNHIVYDSFGKVKSQSNASVEFRYGYTGREQDNETGLDYYRARYYDAANGRFISEDPIGFSAGDSNLTRYVGNSPTNWVDPSGLQELPNVNIIDNFGTGIAILYTAGKLLYDYSPGSIVGKVIQKGANAGIDWSTRPGGWANGGSVSNGTVPNSGSVSNSAVPKKTISNNAGVANPNYGVKKYNEPWSKIKLHTGNEDRGKFKVPNHTTFPGTGRISIGDCPPGLIHKPSRNDNLFIPFFSSEWDPFNPKAIWDNSVNLNDLRNAADKVIPGNNMGLTVGARALDKHANKQGGRGTTPFPKLKGGPKERRRVALEQVDDIITSPDAVFVRLGGGGLEVRIPDGRGARWDSDGSFSGFVN
jgi:RHS repeat-associated protein